MKEGKKALRVLATVAATLTVSALVLAGLFAIYVALLFASCASSNNCFQF